MSVQNNGAASGATDVAETDRDGQPGAELELARLIVTTLNLDLNPGEIDPDAPLYAEGLGLDSIDILEISLAISKSYGVKLRSDSADNRKIFRSLRSLSGYLLERRKA